MSLKTWKEKYLIKLNPRTATILEMLEAAKRKWIGLSPKNIKKHSLVLYGANTELHEEDNYNNYLHLGSDSCYLCKKWRQCKNCPLNYPYKKGCNLSACEVGWAKYVCFGIYQLMLRVIRKAIKKEKEKNK